MLSLILIFFLSGSLESLKKAFQPKFEHSRLKQCLPLA
jgi:hypothetical protein